MTKYFYRAKNNEGDNIKGKVEAKGKKEAIVLLKNLGLVVFSLKEIKDSSLFGFLLKPFQKVGFNDLVNFTRQLSTMITAGLSLAKSLEILASQAKPAMAMVISDISSSISDKGLTLSEALKHHPNVFSKVYVSLVKAGEAGGVLDEVLLRLADNLEKQKEFRAKIKGAMMYPIIILVAMGGVGTIVMVFVFPPIMTMFAQFDTDLPIATKFLMFVMNFLQKFWWSLGLVVLGLLYGWRFINKTHEGKKRVDKLKLGLPVVGNLLRQLALTDTIRTLALLIKSGIPLIEALNIIAEGTSNLVYYDDLVEVAHKVEKGFSLANAMEGSQNFPLILTQMVLVGEETGKLDDVLFKVNYYFQMESEESVKNLTTLIEPIIMIVLAIGVGVMMAAVIMPMYSLTSKL